MTEEASMAHPSLVRYVLVRGFLQFGLLSAALYVLVIVFWKGGTLEAHHLKSVLAFPLAGLAWGLAMYFFDKWRFRDQRGRG